MRVVHYRERFSPLSETFIYDLLREVQRQAGEQHVLTLRRENVDERPFDPVHLVPTPGRWNPERLWHRLQAEVTGAPASRSGWPVLRARILRQADGLRPAVLHAHFGSAGALLAPVAARLRVPLVTSFYGHDASRQLEDPRWRELLGRTAFRCGHVVALSEEMRDRLVRAGAPGERAHVVHLGKRLDEYPFTPSRQVRRFLSIGRMTEKKGHLDLVAAFARAAARRPDLHLDIAGGGELLGAVWDRVSAEGLESRVTLHGDVLHASVRELLARADAFVLCSRRARDGDCEGTPTVLLEAQAAGLPCVSTRHAGIPETIPVEHHDLLAEEGDVEAIAGGLLRLAEATPGDLARRAERGRQHVARSFDVRTEAARLLELYATVARPPAPRTPAQP